MLIQQAVARQDIAVNLALHQRFYHFFEGIATVGAAAPFRLRVIQDGNRGVMAGIPKQTAEPIGVRRPDGESGPLRIAAMGVEMRRAIPVGEGRGIKGMRDDPVDSTDRQGIGDHFIRRRPSDQP